MLCLKSSLAKFRHKSPTLSMLVPLIHYPVAYFVAIINNILGESCYNKVNNKIYYLTTSQTNPKFNHVEQENRERNLYF